MNAEQTANGLRYLRSFFARTLRAKRNKFIAATCAVNSVRYTLCWAVFCDNAQLWQH